MNEYFEEGRIAYKTHSLCDCPYYYFSESEQALEWSRGWRAEQITEFERRKIEFEKERIAQNLYRNS